MTVRPLFAGLLALLVAALVGCDDSKPRDAAPAPEPAEPTGKLVKVGPNVFLEVLPKSRRVRIEAEVCLRQGALEQLLTRKDQKEHEAILTADLDAADVHKALILANAKEGKPVRWKPKYTPPTGTAIKITLLYADAKGKKVSASARSWIKNHKTEKELEADWVFAGSVLVGNPLDPNAAKRYVANDGDLVCVSNYEGAMLDVPVRSSGEDHERSYDAWTDRIPPVGTKVTLVLEPLEEKKEKK